MAEVVKVVKDHCKFGVVHFAAPLNGLGRITMPFTVTLFMYLRPMESYSHSLLSRVLLRSS